MTLSAGRRPTFIPLQLRHLPAKPRRRICCIINKSSYRHRQNKLSKNKLGAADVGEIMYNDNDDIIWVLSEIESKLTESGMKTYRNTTHAC